MSEGREGFLGCWQMRTIQTLNLKISYLMVAENAEQLGMAHQIFYGNLWNLWVIRPGAN